MQWDIGSKNFLVYVIFRHSGYILQIKFFIGLLHENPAKFIKQLLYKIFLLFDFQNLLYKYDQSLLNTDEIVQYQIFLNQVKFSAICKLLTLHVDMFGVHSFSKTNYILLSPFKICLIKPNYLFYHYLLFRPLFFFQYCQILNTVLLKHLKFSNMFNFPVYVVQ